MTITEGKAGSLGLSADEAGAHGRPANADRHYPAIAKALWYLSEHALSAPSLTQVAQAAGLSPHHFQRLFTEYVGVSPKKFSQCLTLNIAKHLLHTPVTLLEAAELAGLSGTGRLHDLFIHIEAMTPGEYQAGGQGLIIHYSQQLTPFGEVGVASTAKGVCDLSFAGLTVFKQQLQSKYPKAQLLADAKPSHLHAAEVISGVTCTPLHLHLRGTPFQLKVWQLLLQIPAGQLTSYGTIASLLEKPQASRAVGAAIGANPVAFLVPCHRVIQATGALGGYRWDTERKRAMLAWEACTSNSKTY